jgi:hypothetical protein
MGRLSHSMLMSVDEYIADADIVACRIPSVEPGNAATSTR